MAVQGARWAGITRLGSALAAATLALLASLTCRQSAMYKDDATLFRATVARNPDADMAHNNLGLALFRAGDMEEAMAHLQKAVELRPDSAHAQNNLANALHVIGSVREAVAHYELSLKLEPGNARTWNNLATLLACSWDASARDGKRAIECALRACQLTGGSNPFTREPWRRRTPRRGDFRKRWTRRSGPSNLPHSIPNHGLPTPCPRSSNCIGPGSPSTNPHQLQAEVPRTVAKNT